MQSRSVRLIAIFAVFAMIATPLAAVSFESNDSDADVVDYKNYYYDQLDTAGKWIYDQVIDTPTFQYVFEKTFNRSDIMGHSESDFDIVSAKLINDVRKGINALSVEHPEAIYWLKLNASMNTSSSDSDTIKITVTFSNADYDSFGTDKTVSDAAITGKLADISASIGTGNIKSKVTYLYDHICGMLTYDLGDPEKTNEVRSLYTSLVGDGQVVCEGYAKTFKALCDYNNIPCLILSGEAGTEYSGGELQTEGHMWNCVKLENDCWYLVDATWGDQTTVDHTYLLAGTETDGFNSVKVGVSHTPSTVTGYGFAIPSLSNISADQDAYVVTFMSEGKVFTKIAVEKDQKMAPPSEKPTKSGYNFYRWCSDPGLTAPYDWNSTVTSDMTLYAEFTLSPIVYIHLVDKDTKRDVEVIRNDQTDLSIVLYQPDDKKFIGWNTAEDGSGVYYTRSDKVTLAGDLTLYAVYESSGDNAVSVAIDKLNEFLAGDSVVPGVSNTVFLIGICSGVLLLLGFMIIFVKK